MLNVTRLRVIRELAVRGSIAATADALWLTPSAVSQHLAALERETQRQLVERSSCGVRLTDAGRALASASGPVFAALEDAATALASTDREPAGYLRVAAFPSVVRVIFPEIISRLKRQFPRLVVEVGDLEGAQSIEALRLEHVDLAVIDDLGWEAGASREGIKITELFSDELVVAYLADHPLASFDTITWADLADHDMLSDPGDSLWSRAVARECRRAGFEPRVNVRVHDGAAALAFVEAGITIAILPRLAVFETASEAIRWRTLHPVVHRVLLAATRDSRAEIPAVRALIDELRAASGYAPVVQPVSGSKAAKS
jgi:DNA-binding transcriptional LysR family regulator